MFKSPLTMEQESYPLVEVRLGKAIEVKSGNPLIMYLSITGPGSL